MFSFKIFFSMETTCEVFSVFHPVSFGKVQFTLADETTFEHKVSLRDPTDTGSQYPKYKTQLEEGRTTQEQVNSLNDRLASEIKKIFWTRLQKVLEQDTFVDKNSVSEDIKKLAAVNKLTAFEG